MTPVPLWTTSKNCECTRMRSPSFLKRGRNYENSDAFSISRNISPARRSARPQRMQPDLQWHQLTLVVRSR